MRTYGRVAGVWKVVETDAAGNDDLVWASTLAQCLKLTPGESPFFADYGIPAQASVVTQVYPDFYVSKMQSKFAQYFASLVIARVQSPDGITPAYNVNIVTNSGVSLNTSIAI